MPCARPSSPCLGLRVAWAWAASLAGARRARAAVIEGQLPATRDFAPFVGKFCYGYTSALEHRAGEVTLEILSGDLNSASPRGKLYFMLFDDEPKHWKKIRGRWETSTCAEKIEDASDTVEITPANFRLRIRIREHLRPRFWYFAVVACDMQLDEPVRYRLHAINYRMGWQGEISLDHTGLVTVYAVFAGLFALATLATFRASRRRLAQHAASLRDHPYLQLLLLSCAASSASCALFLAHYGLYMRDGHGSQRLRFLAVVAATVANCTMFLIAILSSTGWAISSFKLPHRRCFLGMIMLVGGLTALCDLHAETRVDQSTKLYNYQSGPGVVASMLKLFIFCWFAFQTKTSYDEELHEAHRRFYKHLGISMSGWSLNVPVTVMLAFLLAPWVRYKVVTGVEVIARFVGQVLLSWLFCGPLSPIAAENTFPAASELAPAGAPFGRLAGDGGPADAQRCGKL